MRRQMPDGTYKWLGRGYARVQGIAIGNLRRPGAAGYRRPSGPSALPQGPA